MNIEPVGKSITWGFDVSESGSKIKFVLQVNDQGRWVETGEFSRDGGKTWVKFMEMELSKVPNPFQALKMRPRIPASDTSFSNMHPEPLRTAAEQRG